MIGNRILIWLGIGKVLRSIHDCNHRGNTVVVVVCTKRGLIVFIGPCQTVFFYLLTCCCCRAGKNPDILIPKRNSKGPKCTFLRTKFQIVHKKKKIEFHFLLFGVVYSKRGNSLVW